MNDIAIKTENPELVSDEIILKLKQAFLQSQVKDFIPFPQINPDWKFRLSDIENFLWFEDMYVRAYNNFYEQLYRQCVIEV